MPHKPDHVPPDQSPFGHLFGRQTNQNPTVFDTVLEVFGLTRREAVSLGLRDEIFPVVLIDPDAPPQFQAKGVTPFNVAAGGAGTRSESAFTCAGIGGSGGSGGCAKVWFVHQGCGQAVEVVLNPTLTGYTNTVTSPWDIRRGTPSNVGYVQASRRNNVAANGTGNPQSQIAATALGLWVPFEIGPFWLGSGASGVGGTAFNTILVRPIADNVALVGWWRWEFYASRKA